MSNLNARRWVKQCVAAATSRPTAGPARPARPALSVHRLEDRWVPTSLPPGSYSSLPTGSAFEFDQAGTYTIAGNLTVNPGVTLTVGRPGVAVNLVLNNNAVLTVNGTLGMTSPASVRAVEDSFTADQGILVGSVGTLTATDAAFGLTGGSANDTSFVRVDAGGRVSASGCTFGWDQFKVSNGGDLAAGGLVGNGFDTALFVPADLVPRLENNLRFRDVNLNTGSGTGPALSLRPLGTQTTAAQRYVFPGAFDIAKEATVTVEAGTSLVLRNNAVLTVNGGLRLDSPASVVVEEDSFTADQGIAVGATGTLTATNATFAVGAGASANDRSFIRVADGGRLAAAGSQFKWDQLTFANGGGLGAGGLVGNAFETALAVPAALVPQLADNLRFQDVNLNTGSPIGADLVLNPLGTQTTAGQRYVFPAAFAVPAANRLTFGPGAAVVLRNNAVLTVAGDLRLSSPASVAAEEDSFTAEQGIVVGATGTLTATNAAFGLGAGSGPNDQTVVRVDAGGRLTMRGGSFGWDKLTLNAASTGTVKFITLTGSLALNSGATLAISDNDLRATPTNGIVASGAAGTTIPLARNFWGGLQPSQIADRITDKFDTATLPEVVFQPVLTAAPVNLVVADPPTGLTYTGGPRSVPLSATFVSPVGTVSDGTATFTVLDQSAATVATESGPVLNGAAGVSLTLPAGTPAGAYTVRVTYAGSTAFTTAQGDGTLTIGKAAVGGGTIGGLGPVTYTVGSRQITVSASVTSPAGTVGGGAVAVSVRNGSNTEVGGGSLTVGADGKASGPITLNAGTPVGDYTVSAGYSGSANFLAAANFASQPLAVTKAAATASADAAAVTYKAAGRTVPLTARVQSGAGVVGEGQVTFTLYDASNTTPVGASKAVAVSNGTAAVDYPLAAGSPVGGYVVRVSYVGAANFVDAGGTGPLTVTKAAPAITVGAVSKTVSAAAQVVRLTAAVADPPEAVGEGAVTFTVFDPAGNSLGGPTGPATVTAGQAAADYTLPAGTPAGGYRVRAVFAGASNYQDRTAEAPAALTVTRNPTAVAVAPVGAVTYSSGPQAVTVSAGVTSGGAAVGEGQVRFTLQGLAGVTAQTVGVGGDGRAAATFALPAGATAGSYPVQAEYLGTGLFDGASDTSRALAVNKAAVTLAVTDAAATFAAAGGTVTLRADLTSAAGPVAGGTVTFTVLDGGSPVGSPVAAGVAGGAAAAAYLLPGDTPGGSYTVRVAYRGAANFTPAGPADRPALAVTPAAVTGTHGEAAAVAYSGAGQPVAVRAELAGGGGPVAGGTVTFAAFDGAVQVSDTRTAAVVNGAAAATLQLPPGTPAGVYIVRATFGGTPSVAAGPLPERPLTVTPAGVALTVPGVSAGFNPTAATPVLLTAALTSPAGAVVGGTVTFTVLDGPTPVGEPQTAAVEGGTASVNYSLLAGTRAGPLTVRASYSGAVNFAAGSADVAAAVTVDKAAVGVAVRAAAVDYRVGSRPVTLAADLTSPAGSVGGGTATFTVLRGGAVVAESEAAVANGVAAAVVTLPPGTPAGDLTVRVGYSGTADLAAATADGTLAVRPATTAVVVADAAVRVRPAGQAVQLSAAVTSPAGVVGAGAVTFTVFRGPALVGSPVTVPVTGGVATAGYPLPPGGGAGDLAVQADYTGTAELTGSGAAGTLTLTRSPAGLIGEPQSAAGSGGPGGVRFFNPDGTERARLDPFPGFAGGVRVAAADFTGDGVADVVTGTGPGRATRVVVSDGVTQAVLFALDPFESRFTGGVFVAAGDLTGDGIPDLVITPDEGGGPRARVFSGAGFGQLADFFGIDDPAFRGGARAAVGDVTGDGVGDLVVAAGYGGGPRVAVFDGTGLDPAAGAYTRKPAGDFFAFEDTLRNGVYVAVGDVDGDGRAEVVAGGGPGGGPRVTAFSGADLLDGGRREVANFFAGDDRDRDGVRVAVKDLDGDARADLVTGPGSGGRVRAYAGTALTAGGPPAELFALDAFDGRGGVFVG